VLDISTLEKRLRAAFPQRTVEGVIAPHDCEECVALRANLKNETWDSVPDKFVGENADVLPLLSEAGYAAYLPAWIQYALRQPNSDVANMLLVNLGHEPRTSKFNAAQASLIIEVAEFLTANNAFGAADPVNQESRAKIAQAWAELRPNKSLERTRER